MGRVARDPGKSLLPFFRPQAFSAVGLSALSAALPRDAGDRVITVPFLGGGDLVLFLASVFPNARRIVATDGDASLVGAFVALRDALDEVLEVLGDAWDRVAGGDVSRVRAMQPVKGSDVAAREILLFNARRGDPPLGGLAFWEVEEYLSEVSGWLQRVTFRAEDPVASLNQVEGGDSVVLGLPFVGVKRAAVVDSLMLRDAVRGLSRRDAQVVFLGDASSEVIGAFGGVLNLRFVPEAPVRSVVGVNFALSRARRGAKVRTFAQVLTQRNTA